VTENLHVGGMVGREGATNREGGKESEKTEGEGMVKEGKSSGEVMGAAERRIQKPCLQLEPALFTARATNRIALS